MVVDIDTIIKVVVALLIFVLEVLLYTPVLSLQAAGGSDGSPNYSGGYAGGVSGTRGNFGCGSYGMVDLKLLHIHL